LPAERVAVAVLVDDADLGADKHRGGGEEGRAEVQPKLDDAGQALEQPSVQTGGEGRGHAEGGAGDAAAAPAVGLGESPAAGGVGRGAAQGAARGAGAAPGVGLLGSPVAGGSGSFRTRCGLRGGTAGSGLPAGGIAVPVGRGQPHGGGGRGESGAGQGGSSG